MSIEDLVHITELLGFAAAVIFAVFKGIAFLNQTNISLTLLSHSEREKYRIVHGITVFIVFSILCYATGVFFNVALTTFRDYSEQKQAQEIIMAQEDTDVGELDVETPAKEMASIEAISIEEIAAIAFLLFLLIVAILFGFFFANGVRKREKDKTQYYKVRKRARYFCIGVMFFLSVLMLEICALMGMVETIEQFCIRGIAVSLLHGVLIVFTISITNNRYGDEIALLKSYYKDRVVYLFELKDGYYVAGDNMYMSDCEEHWMIAISELNEPLIDATSEDDVYLLKKNVEICKGFKRSRNSVLRTVAADSVKSHNIDLNTVSWLKVEFDDKKIKYTICKDGTNHTFLVEDKAINRYEWNGNVLLL